MDLSSDLISQFVKYTNDNKKNDEGSTVYGTTKLYDEKSKKWYVHIDGTDEELYTPVSTTADMKPGERVAVLIKKHSAIVTGNTSFPSAKAEDVKNVQNDIKNAVTTDQLNAATAKINDALIGKLDASVAEITYATIENLRATNAKVDSLTGEQGTFVQLTTERLDVVEGTIEELDSTYAKITDLNAVTAEIVNLDADIANIDTLIFGSATGDTIQTSFSNAVIAQLGDAQIKSAMIESVSAGKITAGDIITNNVRVKSEDGSLLISDETMQISDDNRVRVQIGKDASGDYSINIWDQNGNLMFSKGGITDSAIKDAIIRNDMVSDTANIAAHKLDIDSLFEEINDSSKTIKSTKIYVDEKNQTLDVAFKSIITDVDGLKDDMTSQGTQISAIQGQISSKIWQQDIDTAKSEMSTQYSTLSQGLESFKSTVGDTYATKNALTNVESSIEQMSDRITETVSETTNLGTRVSTVEQTASGLTTRLTAVESYDISGRNLIANTAFGPANTHRIYSSSGTLTRTAEGLKLVCGAGTYKNGFLLPLVADGCLENGQKYTLSFQYRTNISATGTVYVMQRTTPNVSISGEITLTPSESAWQTFTLTFSNNSINDRVCHSILIPYMTGEGNWIEIRDRTIKLEKGSKATKWSAAHEDASLAAKTATNYLNFSTAGLVIGDMTASTLGKNILIDSDSVDIRSGTSVRASFGEDYLYLAKHSKTATIDMCNGLAKLYHAMDGSYSQFVIDTTNYNLSSTKVLSTRWIPMTIETTAANTDIVIMKSVINGATVGAFGMNSDGYMVRYGSEIADNVVTTNPPVILDTANFAEKTSGSWVNCTLNSGAFTRYNNDIPQPQVRKIGKQVYLRGEAKPVTAVTPASDSDTVIATIPSGYRPSERQQFVMQGSGSYRWMMSIHTDGRIAISRYSNSTTANMNIAAGAWLCCHAQWLID